MARRGILMESPVSVTSSKFKVQSELEVVSELRHSTRQLNSLTQLLSSLNYPTNFEL
jgi:hypothetical protein